MFKLLPIVFLLLVSPLNAQNVQIFGNPGNDEYGYCTAGGVDGCTYIGGSIDHYGQITKLDAFGNLTWSKTFILNTLPSHHINVTSMHVLADTLYGCGSINSGSVLLGFHYFKMNATTGDFYWTQSETASSIYFSSMRYDAGKYYLAGTKRGVDVTWDAKLMCVSSADGSVIWQNGTLGVAFPSFSNDYVDDIYGMSEIVNNTLYLIGRSYVNGSPNDMRPVLLGYDLSGNMILHKYLLLPDTDAGIDRFYGSSIECDGTDSLIIAIFGDDNCTGSCLDIKVGLIKTDLNGDVSFAKTYDLASYSHEGTWGFAVSDDAYVIYGGTNYTLSNSGVYAIKTDKNGVFQNATVITKPLTTLRANPGPQVVGNSCVFANSMYTFTGSAYTSDPNMRDILVIQLDENLQGTNDCFTFTSVSVITQIYTPFSEDLIVIDKTNIVNPVIGFTDDIYTFSVCGPDSITFQQTQFACDSVTVEAVSTSGIGYQVTWPSGTIGNTETFYQSDTVTVEFFNPLTCCIFSDSVVVNFDSGIPEVILPPDTTICIDWATTYTIIPTITNCNTCTFEWNNGSDDSVLSVDTTGWYTVSVTNSCGGQDEDSVYITINYIADVSTINDTMLCPSGFPLTISASYTYADSLVWSDGTTGTSALFNLPGPAFVQAYSACGMEQEDFVIDVIPAPGVLLPMDTNICVVSDSSYTLIPVITNCDACIFEWNDGSVDSVLSVDTTGWYTVSVTNSCGNQSEDSIYFELNYFPNLSVINDTSLCFSDFPLTISVTAAYADSLVWSDGTTGSSNVFNLPGVAFVQAYAPCGMLQENFTIDTIAHVSIQPITSIDTCLYVGQQLTIPITAANYTSLTANDVVLTSPTVIAVDDTMFNIVASNVCGADSIQFTVAIGPYPVYTNPGGIDTCLADGTPLEIEVDVTDAVITWWNGSNNEQQTITSEGTYFFTIANSCAAIPDSIVVSYSTQPSISFLGTLDTCLLPGDSLLVSYTGSGLTVFWSANGNDTLFVTESGTYYAEVGTPCGVMFDSLQITIHPIQQLPQLDTLHFCGAVLHAADLGISAEYPVIFTSASGDSLGNYIFESGDYVVHQYTPCGELQENFSVIFDSEIFFYAPNSFTPGDDELNGIYAFKGENYTIQEVLIFDRWGQVIYSQKDAFDGWDGNHNGHICPTGTYVVKVTYTACDDIPETLFLHVNLLR